MALHVVRRPLFTAHEERQEGGVVRGLPGRSPGAPARLGATEDGRETGEVHRGRAAKTQAGPRGALVQTSSRHLLMGRDSPHTLVRAVGAGSHPQHFPWPKVPVEQTACTTEHSSPGLYQLSDENTGHRTQPQRNRARAFSQLPGPNRPGYFTLQSFHCCVTSARALPLSGPSLSSHM